MGTRIVALLAGHGSANFFQQIVYGKSDRLGHSMALTKKHEVVVSRR
jgi:hypothetical protein